VFVIVWPAQSKVMLLAPMTRPAESVLQVMSAASVVLPVIVSPQDRAEATGRGTETRSMDARASVARKVLPPIDFEKRIHLPEKASLLLSPGWVG